MRRSPPYGKPFKRETLADRLADEISELILSGSLEPGATLPTEVQLADRYGVSRAVVRDATRLLSARGLVDVRHGRGVFVTSSQDEAFGDALLLALRRDGATAWDLEEFERLFFPAVLSLVCSRATDKDLASVRAAADAYTDRYRSVIERRDSAEDPDSADALQTAFGGFLQAVYRATHNRVVIQLGRQLTSLRRGREWSRLGPKEALETDRRILEALVGLLEERDAGGAWSRVSELLELPPEAVAAMKKTPIGDIPRLRVDSELRGDT